MRDWIQSYTGKKVTPFDLKPEQVCLEDIAHALSNKTRFTGHTRDFYSVAQHCVLGSQCLPPSYALAFLLHDVNEAYLPDVASPIKAAVLYRERDGGLQPWTRLEYLHSKVILEALGHGSLLPLMVSAEIHAMDLSMCLAERDALLGPSPDDWGIPGEPAPTSIKAWSPLEAEERFLARYRLLTTKGLYDSERVG